MAPKTIGKTTEAKYRRRFEEGYDAYDLDYYKWMKYNHPVEAETWIKSAIRTEDANNVEKSISSAGNTDQAPESETTKDSCKNPGPSKPSEQLKYISRFLVQAIPAAKEKDKGAPKRISGGQAFTRAECIMFLEEKEAQKQKDQEEKQNDQEEKHKDQKEKQKKKEEREKKRKGKEKENGKSKKSKKTLRM